MTKRALLAGVVTLAVSVIAGLACGDTGSEETLPVTPMPNVASGPLSFTVAVTEIGVIGPTRAILGVDPFPTGVDMVNIAFYTFTRAVDRVRIELLLGGRSVFDRDVPLDPPSSEMRLPLSADVATILPAELEPGLYQRRVTVTGEDGETLELFSDTVWLLSPDGSPEAEARGLLAEALGTTPDSPFLVAYEAVDWDDASLGCLEPGMMYAQVTTPGFRLMFDHQGARYEYHTNLDASVAALCQE